MGQNAPVTAANLWTQFVSKECPNGSDPEVYRQIKMCFYSGMMTFFTILAEIDQMTPPGDIDADEEGMIMERFRQEITNRNGRAKSAYETWLRDCYSDVEMLPSQRKTLEETFYRSMEIGFFATTVLAGAMEEDDSIGARRLTRLRTEVFNELGRMVGAA